LDPKHHIQPVTDRSHLIHATNDHMDWDGDAYLVTDSIHITNTAADRQLATCKSLHAHAENQNPCTPTTQYCSY